MNKKTIIIFILILATFLFLNSQIYNSAKSTSLSDAYMMAATGSDAIYWNPALLGNYSNNVTISFGLIPIIPINSINIGNNSINTSWFNRYFASGLYLTDEIKNDMLSFIPGTGLSLMGLVNGRLIGIQIKNFALAFNFEIIGKGNIPKDVFKLIFEGNQIGKAVDLSNLGINAYSLASLDLGYGRKLENELIERVFKSFTIGFSTRLLYGIVHARTDYVNGSLTCLKEGIHVIADTKTKLGFGGFGFSVGTGVTGKINEKIEIGLSFNNIISNISWGLVNTYERQFTYDKLIEPDEIFDENSDSLLEQGIVLDTLIENGEKFNSRLTPYITLGGKFKPNESITTYFNIIQPLGENLIYSTLPMIASGLELNPSGFFPIRFGLSIGGGYGIRWGTGFSLQGKRYSFNFGFSQSSGFFNHAKGFIISFGQELRF